MAFKPFCFSEISQIPQMHPLRPLAPGQSPEDRSNGWLSGLSGQRADEVWCGTCQGMEMLTRALSPAAKQVE